MASTTSQFRQRRIAIAVGIIATLVVVTLDWGGWLEWAELRTLDWRFRRVASIPIRDDITIVAIDDKSLEQVGRWPWPRDVQAGLIRVLHEAGARAILVDINWFEPEPVHGRASPNFDMEADARDFMGLGVELVCPDLQLADALSEAGNCYLSLSLDQASEQQKGSDSEEGAKRERLRNWLNEQPERWTASPRMLAAEFLPQVTSAPFYRDTREKEELLSALRFELSTNASLSKPLLSLDPVRSIAKPAPEIMPVYYLHARAAQRCGFVTYRPDSDGVVRRQWPFANVNGHLVSQVAFSLLWDELEIDPARCRVANGALHLTDIHGRTFLPIPLDASGRLLVPWAFRAGRDIQFNAVPAAALIAVDQRRELIKRNDRSMIIARNQFLLEALPDAQRPALEKALNDQATARANSFAARYAEQLETSKGAAADADRTDNEIAELEAKLVADAEKRAVDGAGASDAELAAARAFLREHAKLDAQRELAAQTNARFREDAEKQLTDLRPRVKGKICLIGYTATAQGDIVVTPLSPQTSGVLAHAHLINGLLHSLVMNWTPAALNSAIAALLGIAATVVGALWRPRAALAVCGLLIVVHGLAVLGAFRWGNLWVPLVSPIAALVAAYTALTIYQYFFVEAQRRRLSTALTQFTSPEIARQVADDPELCRKAETREVTAMFTDLRGFTPISERIGAERTQRVLNLCLERFCEVLLRREAIINKFMGDGVFAFWNPLIYPQPNHARLGCEAALDLIAALRGLVSQQQAAGGDEAFGDLFLRIGLATGNAVVGPCGSEQKYDYTCIGDCVNVAARLESTNKAFETSILVNDEVRRQAGDAFVFRPLGGVRVKGKLIPVQVYELIGRTADVGTDETTYIKEFGDAIERFRNRDFAEARRRFNACLAQRPEDSAASAFVRECERLEAAPPPPDWQPAIDTA